MKKSLLTTTILFTTLLLSAQKRDTCEVKWSVPLYYEQLVERFTYPMAYGNSPIRNFNKWKKAARTKLTECMMDIPPAAPFDYQVIASEQRNGYKVQKIEFTVSTLSRSGSYLLIPDGDGPFPAILALHDHGGQYYIGKEKMVRAFGVDDNITKTSDAWVENLYGGKYIAEEYAKAGYVVLVTDVIFWGERGSSNGSETKIQQDFTSNMFQLGMSWTGVMAYDDMRSVDFIESLPFVKKDKIGAVGLSMGGYRAWMVGALSEKVAATAAICWITTTKQQFALNGNKRGETVMFIPGLARYMDIPHIVTMICPRPLLMFNGTRDKLFPVAAVEDAYGTISEVWQSQKASDKLVTKLWDAPHEFNLDMQKETMLFLDKYLK